MRIKYESTTDKVLAIQQKLESTIDLRTRFVGRCLEIATLVDQLARSRDLAVADKAVLNDWNESIHNWLASPWDLELDDMAQVLQEIRAKVGETVCGADIGAQFKTVRQRAFISQQQISDESGVNLTAVTRFELGETIDPIAVQRINAALTIIATRRGQEAQQRAANLRQLPESEE